MSQHAPIQSPLPLSSLLKGIVEVDAANDCNIHGLAIDSREVARGDLFIACRGINTDGARYVADAIAAGAVAVVVEGDDDVATATHPVPVIRVGELQNRLGLIASRFFSSPSQQLFVVGVTGTNGKTSCCHFLAQALQLNGKKCGVIGTLGYGLAGALQPATHTTPNPVVLQSQLRAIRDAGAAEVVMEVSSHALAQGRVAGVAFDVALFTNLTRDHLDYHGDFEAYGAAKQKLFAMPGLSHAVINRDDPFGVQLLASLPLGVKAVVYGLVDRAQFDALDEVGVYGQMTALDESGIEMRVATPKGAGVLRSEHLLGEFNARNLLAVLAVLLLMDVTLERALGLLAQVRNAAGRMERLGGEGLQPLVVIDYAHTPDALQNVLNALRGHCRGRLWCLFGCGGDRDSGKRPLMGTVATQYADVVVITDDNPRNEDAVAIVRDITAGISSDSLQGEEVRVIHDRAAAIDYAVRRASADDVVVIAGKGHEQYQLIGEQRLPFSDRDCAQMILQEVA